MDPECILIVDDDRDVAATVGDYLTREGYAVATAETGAQGLERLRQGGVALLLVDLHLPDMDGALVMRAAQQLTASPEVVVITGYATVDSAVQAVGGTAGYLMKPIELAPRDLPRRLLGREPGLHPRIALRRVLPVLAAGGAEVALARRTAEDADRVVALPAAEERGLLGIADARAEIGRGHGRYFW